GLEIAMNDLALVRSIETNRDLRKHADDALGRDHLLALEHETKLLALEELHHQEPNALDRITLEIEHLHDVIVRQLARDLVLAVEALEADFIFRNTRVKHLHSDACLRDLVDAFVHTTHATIGDHASKLVPITELRPDARILFVARNGDHARELQLTSVHG